MLEAALAKFSQLKNEKPDLYELLNAYRDWFNQTYSNYEVMLEDDWETQGVTYIEYYLRCLETLNISEPFARDIYLSHRDAKGVCHLDDYQSTELLVLNIEEFFVQFVLANVGLV